ncbi:hypothetical protein K1T71_002723 [Dendrolimus kikuchii]|uniref:Uncharacterized protein n=1 Tax=Dendrolimus kikuchii TaxID=765133 RepID=A0ACC1DDU9_9NEOP|nr:hypothetical protein K1T71_002723 [Dendrolimus kikuchii]
MGNYVSSRDRVIRIEMRFIKWMAHPTCVPPPVDSGSAEIFMGGVSSGRREGAQPRKVARRRTATATRDSLLERTAVPTPSPDNNTRATSVRVPRTRPDPGTCAVVVCECPPH